MRDLDPDLDLELGRIIRAPRDRVWRAWTQPDELAKWWVPAPSACRVERLEVVAGGGFVTLLSDDGDAWVPHMDACFVAVYPGERIVFTNALDSRLRPASPEPVAMTAQITFRDHAEGTAYGIRVRHADDRSRRHHEVLGFADGWGTALTQLVRLAESAEAR